MSTLFFRERFFCFEIAPGGSGGSRRSHVGGTEAYIPVVASPPPPLPGEGRGDIITEQVVAGERNAAAAGDPGVTGNSSGSRGHEHGNHIPFFGRSHRVGHARGETRCAESSSFRPSKYPNQTSPLPPSPQPTKRCPSLSGALLPVCKGTTITYEYHPRFDV